MHPCTRTPKGLDTKASAQPYQLYLCQQRYNSSVVLLLPPFGSHLVDPIGSASGQMSYLVVQQ